MKNNYYHTSRITFTLLVSLFLVLSNGLFAQVDVTASGGTPSASYTTLKDAFDAINAGTHQGTITLDISANTTEAATAVLNASGAGLALYTSILVKPTGGAARTISGTIAAAAMIELNGADNVTFDGLNTGGNSLTIVNTSNASTSGTSTIRLYNDATLNLFTNLTINGASTTTIATNGGTIFFSTAASGGTGNDNNTISNCNIGPDGANYPSKAIYANGTSSAIQNDQVTINNCNIYDYFLPAGTHAGIYISTGNSNWTISNSRFYQTTAKVATGTTAAQAIQIANTTGENIQITSNTFGFANSSGTGFSSYSGAFAVSVRMIQVSCTTTGVPCGINGNTISGINLSGSTSTGTTTAAIFGGIVVSAGLVNIGGVSGNTIGSLSGSNSISITTNSTSTTGDMYGIYYGGSHSNTISNNQIGNISVTNSNTGSAKLYVIRSNSSATGPAVNTISDNLIGSATNTIVNASTSASSFISGIQSNLGKAVITNNVIRNLSVNNANINATTTASIVGIYNSATATNTAPTISGNTIFNLENTHASAAVSVTGMLITGANPPLSTALIERNFIHSLSVTSTAGTINGIFVTGGAADYQNNMIRLGSTMSTAAKIYGIQETGSGTNNYYFNTVYIGNTGIGSTVSNTFAYSNASTTTGTRGVLNNIFFNARSNAGAGGKHYAVFTAGTAANPAGLTINYNIYRATGTGGVLGLYNALDKITLGDWQTAVGQDANSLISDPCLANADGLPGFVDLHLTNCSGAGSPAESAGLAVGSVTTDFDGQTRASLSPTDIGADAGLYGPTGKDVGISALIRPTAVTCHSAAEDVIVRLSNFSDPIDFSVDNVTVDVTISGTVSGFFTTTLTSGSLLTGGFIDLTMGQINTTANGNYTFASTATMAGDINNANNNNNTTITINYVALSATATALQTSICAGQSTTLTAVPVDGTSPYTYSWSPGGATTVNPSVSPASNTTYTVTVTDACGIQTTADVAITVNDPQVLSTTPQSRCGTGTVQLSATVSGGATTNWYTAPSGGTPISNLSTYTTPTISTTTSYYVSASIGGTNSFVSKLAPEPASTGTVLTTYGQDFTVTSTFTLNSVQVYSTTGTAITISLYSSGGTTQLMTTGSVGVTAGTSPTIPIGWVITPGTYRLCTNGMTGNFIRDNSGVTYPFALGTVGTMNGFVSSITGTVTTSAAYYFTYNWSISTGCESARQLVVATINPPPGVNLTPNPTGPNVCEGTNISFTAASPANDPNYTYSWSFNNGSTVATGSAFSFVINKDSTVVLTAEDLNGASPNFGCKLVISTPFVAKDSVDIPNISPASPSVCPGGSVVLSVTNASQGLLTYSVGPPNNGQTSGYTLEAGLFFDVYSAFKINGVYIYPVGTGAGTVDIALLNPSGSTIATYTFSGTGTAAPGVKTFVPLNFNITTPGTGYALIMVQRTGLIASLVRDGSADIVGGTFALPNPYMTSPGLMKITSGRCCPSAVSTSYYYFYDWQLEVGAPVVYTWSPGGSTGTSLSISPSVTTTYTVTGSNSSSGCSSSSSVTVTVSDVAYASSTPVSATCFGGADGSITINATGSYPPFQYSIDNGTSYQSSNAFSGLTAGNYSVRIKDALNCETAAQVVVVGQSTAITFTGTPVNATCYGASDGSISISNEAGGNGGPYTYSINNGTSYQSSASFTGLAAGTYQVRVKDALGCESAASAVVVGTTPSTQYTITATSGAGGTISPSGSVSVDCGADQLFTFTPNTCYTLESVYVDGNLIGNPSTYTFTSVLANHTIHANFVLLTYTVTATNGTGGTISPVGVSTVNCGSNLSFTITPDPGNIVDDVLVDGVSVGAPLSYTFTNIVANHTIDATFTTCTTPATANAGSNSAICDGQNFTLAGSIGGTASSATWSTSGTGSFSPSNDFATATTYIPSSADITAGSVILTLTTDNPAGPCPAASASMTLTINPLPTVTIGGILGFCPSASTTLTANSPGTITGYQWSLDISTPLGTTQTQAASVAGTYGVVVTDNNSCTNSTSVAVIAADEPVTTITGTSPVCAGTSSNLTANPTVTNGTIASYLWYLNGTSVGLTTPSVSVSQTGTYTVVVSSSYGCSATSSSFLLTNGTGPLSGLYTINSSLPASCTNFISFKDAFTAINVNGVAGNVTVDVSVNHTETAPAGGLKINMCSLAPSLQSGSAQTITFQKSGAGANPKITAQVGTGSLDGIIEIIGGDYITFDGIDVAEDPSNTTSTTRAEWGYALLKCDGTDGSNNNTIKNCAITLDKANANSVGIYSNNHTSSSTLALTVTAVSGANSNNVFIDNTITNTYSGILVVGFGDVTPFALYDQNNQIGQTGHGNQITDFGGGSTTALGIYTVAQNNQSVVANTINSTGSGSQTGNIYGIYTDYAAHATTNVVGNTVTVVSAAGTGQQIAIINNSGSRFGRPSSSSVNNIVSIKDNTVQNCSYLGSGTLGAWIYSARGGADTMSAYNMIITGNQLINNTYSGTVTGGLYGIISQSLVDSASISNNTISNNTMNGISSHTYRAIVTGYGGLASSTIPYVYKINVSGNTISNNVSTATTGVVDNIAIETYAGSSPNPGSKVYIKNNNIGNTTIAAVATAAYNCITTSSTVSTNSTVEITGNTVSNIIRNGATTGAFNGIVTSGTALAGSTISNNTVSGISQTGATTAAFSGIVGSGSVTLTTNLTLNNNTVSNNSNNGTGNMICLNSGSGANITVDGNQIFGNTKTGASGLMYCTQTVGGALTNVIYTNNHVYNNSFLNTSGTTAALLYGHYNFASVTGTENYSNNHIHDLTMSGTNTATTSRLVGLYSGTSASSVKTISNNNIHDLSSNVTGAGAVLTYGMVSDYGAASSTIFKNKIYNITSSTSGTTAAIANGLGLGVFTTSTAGNGIVFNNYIGNINAPNSASTDGVRGINITQAAASTSYLVYYNTIYLAASSVGANFGSSGIFHTTSATSTTSNLDLRNNIIINNSTPAGTGVTAAYRRSSSTLTNFNANSNNNIFYAGTPAANRLIYTDGTNLSQTIAAYKTVVAPRETNSQTENVSFLSTTGSNAQYLHVNTVTPTLVESGAQTITTPVAITDDYDGDVRNVSTPDIGADEGAFVSAALSISSVTASPDSQCTATSHLITAIIVPGSTAVASATLNYAFNGTAQAPIAMTNPSGNTWTATIPVATPSNATVTYSVTASDAAFTKIKSGESYKDNYLSGFSVTATANPNPVCANSTTTLSALVGAAGYAVVGTGSTTSATYSNPFYSLWSNAHNQHLITASELTAAGLAPGNITSLGLTITAAGTLPMLEFSLSVGTTNATNMSAYITSGLTQVYTNASFLPVTGLNTMPFSTPIYWDGTSNLVIEICHGNPSSTATMSRTCEFDNTSYVSTIHTHKTTATGGNAQCTDLTTNLVTFSGRPKFTIGGIVGPTGFSFSWTGTPAGYGLNATTGSTVTATPTAAGVYTYSVLATDYLGCTLSGDVSVTVNPQPTPPVATNSSQCGYGIPNCSVSSGGFILNWYLDPTGGSPIQSGTQTSLTSYYISTTTTFYVSEHDGTCPSQRTPVVQTVIQPDAITASASPNNICLNESVTLNATQTGSTNNYTYSWSASPSTGSGITGSVPNSSVVITPTAAGTYTYTVTGVDAGAGCTYINSTVVTVKELPSITSATGNPNPVCAGSPVTLTGLTGSTAQSVITLGTQTTTIGGANGNPLRTSAAGGMRMQILVLASELAGQGLTAGPIYSLGFTATVATTGSFSSYEIGMAHTNATVLTTTHLTPSFTVVYSQSTTLTPVVGLNDFVFTTPFNWDGTSNIVINLCAGVGNTTSTTVAAYSPGFTGSAQNTGACSTTTGTTVTTKPVMTILGTINSSGPGTYTWVWNPGNISGNVAVVSPNATTTYTVTATDPATTCTSTASVVVNVNQPPPTPTAFNSSHCGTAVPNCAVTSSGFQNNWYLTPTGGFPITGETGTYLVNYTTDVTTTFYVSEFDGSCESPRVAVIEDVISPDPVTASALPITVCPGEAVNLSAVQTGSNNSYVFDWSASPGAGSGISGLITNQNVTVYPTAAGTYTYTVTASDFNTSCVATSDVEVTVKQPPVISSITANPSTVCSGTPVTLTALTATTSSQNVGIGTATTTSTAVGINPLSPFWESNKVQYLILASELSAQGLVAGNITGLAFNITAKGTLSYDWLDYTVKMAHTNVTALTTTFETGPFQTVFGPATIPAASVVIGYNGIPLTPFNWDGTSNIIVDICFTNDPTGTCAACYNPSGSLTYEYTATAYNSVNYDVIDNVSNCGATTTGTTSLNRPNFVITGQAGASGPGTYTWTWNPGSLSGNSVVVTPSVSTTYTVTATDPATSCTSTATVAVDVNPTPAAPVASNSTQCGYGTPTCSVTGNGGEYRWYLVPTGGTYLAGQQNSTLSAYPINTTTTFYVSEYSGQCEGPRTPVIATVTPSDQINASATPASFCLGGSTNLVATNPGSTNTYTYDWTATPSSGSGISGSVPGGNINVTPTVAGTYTYNVTGYDAGLGCSSFNTVVVTVIELPVISSATASPSTVCLGNNVTLTALTGSNVPGAANIGTQTTTIGGSDGNPYRSGNGSGNFVRSQILVLASELQSQGLVAGNITALGFTVTTISGSSTTNNFEIKMGHTIASTLTTTFETTPMTSVFTAASNTPVVGLNIHTFSTPFAWDGVSNIIINVCQLNLSGGGTTTVAAYAPGYNSNLHKATSTTSCTDLTGTIVANKPILHIEGLVSGAGAGSYTWVWNPGALNGNSVVVTPTVNTTYVVTATDPVTQCSSTASVPVEVINAVASAPVAASSVDTLCGPGTVGLSVTNPATGLTYVWQQSSSGNTDTWSNIGSGVALTTSSINATTYYRVYATCGISGDTSNVVDVIVANPSILGTTNGSRCGAGTVTVTVSGTGDFTWWDAPTGGNFLFAGASYTASYSVSTTVYAQANIGTCLYPGGRIPANITINPAPPTVPTISASGPTSFCPGGSVTLTASSGYLNYSWSDGASVVATTASFVATPASTTTYTVTVDDGGICNQTASQVVTIQTLASPVVTTVGGNPTTFCDGSSVTLDAGAGYDTYAWSDGSGTIGTTQTLNVTIAGNYSVTVTLNGCIATSSVTTVVVNPSPPTAIVTPGGPIDLCSNGSNSPAILTADITGAGAGASILWNQDGNPSTTTINVSAGDIDLILNGGTFGYNFEVTNSFGCKKTSNTVTVNEVSCGGATLYAKLFLEGYYSGGGDMNTSGSGGCLYVTGGSANPLDADYVTLSAMSATSPYGLVESQTGVLKTDGTINVTFSNAVANGSSYYIKITHRNALETWSANPVVFSATTALAPYDFSSGQGQAYGGNQSDLFDGNWAIFSGDISDAGSATVGVQDGIIESQDYGDMENAVYVTLLGYVTEDITGDGIVESADYGLMENNVYFTRVLQRP